MAEAYIIDAVPHATRHRQGWQRCPRGSSPSALAATVLRASAATQRSQHRGGGRHHLGDERPERQNRAVIWDGWPRSMPGSMSGPAA